MNFKALTDAECRHVLMEVCDPQNVIERIRRNKCMRNNMHAQAQRLSHGCDGAKLTCHECEAIERKLGV